MERDISEFVFSDHGIPIIDLSGSHNNNQAWMVSTGQQIKQGILTKGLVYLVNHGISEQSLQSVYEIMDTFCQLPDTVKEKYRVHPPNYLQGYAPSGLEKLQNDAKKEVKISYNILSLSDKLPTDEIPTYQEVVGEIAEGFLHLSRLILQIIAISLGLNQDLLLNAHKGMMKEENLTSMRILYYPALEQEEKEDVIRCGEHSDWGTLTLLAQDSEGGLEILQGDEWYEVGYVPGAILLNIADLLELWTCSQYKAVKHRVVAPKTPELRTRARHSVAFFVHPDDSFPADSSFFTVAAKTSSPKASVSAITSKDYMRQKIVPAFEGGKVVQ